MNGKAGWRKLICYTAAVAIYLSCYAIRPYEKDPALSELLLQLGGNRGKLIMGTGIQEIVSLAFKLMPDLVLECYLGVTLYHNFGTASVFLFSRIPNRKKWYFRETGFLIIFIGVYEALLHMLVLLFSVLRFEVQFDGFGFFLLGYDVLLRTLWIFVMSLMMNICEIVFEGSSYGLGITMVQLGMIALLVLCELNPVISHIIPVAMLILGWHHSVIFPVNFMLQAGGIYEDNIQMLTVGRSFEESGLSILLIAIIAEFCGLHVVRRKEIMVSDLESDG